MVPCISGRRTAPWSLGAIHFVAVIHPQSQAGASLTESGSGQVHRYFVHNALSYLSPYYGNLMQPSAAAGSESVSFSFAAHMVLLQQRKQLLGRLRKFMQMVIFIKIEDCSAWIGERGINKEKRDEEIQTGMQRKGQK
jgi:hypothetical protein